MDRDPLYRWLREEPNVPDRLLAAANDESETWMGSGRHTGDQISWGGVGSGRAPWPSGSITQTTDATKPVEEVEESISGDSDHSTDTCLRSEKIAAIDRIVEWFDSWLSSRLARLVQQGSNTSQEKTGHRQAPSTSITHSSRKSKHKRDRVREKKGQYGNDSGDESEDNVRRESKLAKVDTPHKLACPFFKRNPQRYRNARNCVGPGWDSVHRVKYINSSYHDFKSIPNLILREHLYRRHVLSLYTCNRCYKDFKDSYRLSLHQRAETACSICEGNLREGINETQRQKLKVRKKSVKSGPTQTEAEKWNYMFRIIFPDDDKIPGPC